MRGAADKDFLTGGQDIASLPPVIAGMKPKYVSFSSNYLTIEFHGGFDHFGFKVADRGKSWEMSWYTEEERHTLLSIAKGELEQASPPIDKSNISKHPK